jgi:putative ABC transport system ATP-binding protein
MKDQPDTGPATQHGMDAAPMITLDDAELHLASAGGNVNILRGIDWSIAAGETVGVIGPSGSGKSTMIMVIAGLERLTGGTVAVAGQDLSALDEDALARFRRTQVGIVLQAFHLIPTMSALENVAVPLEFAGKADAFDVARESLETLGLGHRLDHYPSQLSGGEQQRVAIARAFAPQPNLLLADEPTGNLDGETGASIIETLFDLSARHGTTLVLITHDPAIAARCGRVVHLRDGQILENPISEENPKA